HEQAGVRPGAGCRRQGIRCPVHTNVGCTMMGNRRSRAISLLLVLGIAALGAQVAGVGSKRPGPKVVSPKTISALPGASIPDVGSTTLASTKVAATEGEIIRLTATATLA